MGFSELDVTNSLQVFFWHSGAVAGAKKDL
jgi:hypothetical protein